MSEEGNRAFNEGSDAALQGQSIKANPYKRSGGLDSMWRSGFRSAKHEWEADVEKMLRFRAIRQRGGSLAEAEAVGARARRRAKAAIQPLPQTK